MRLHTIHILLFTLLFSIGVFWVLPLSLGATILERNFDEESHDHGSVIEEGREVQQLAEQRKKEKLQRIENEYNNYLERVEKKYEEKIIEKQAQISELRDKLDSSFLSFDEQRESSEDSAKKIVETNKKAITLKEEIKIFDTDIAALQKRIGIMESRITLKEDQISLLAGKKSESQKAKDIQESMVLDYFSLYQVADDEFYEASDLTKSMELLFTDRSSAEKIQEIAALQEMEKKSREMFYLMDTTTSRIHEANLIIQKENQKILDFQETLEEQKSTLRDKKIEKRQLLLDTENSEIKYQKLLQKAEEQMKQASNDIQNIRLVTKQVSDELNALERKKRFEERILTKERIREKMLEEIADQNKDLSVSELGKLFAFENSEFAPLQWPVTPKQGISAYFHDEKYKKRFKIGHNAIDIPVPQGTDIKAATAGYVYKTVDNGLGFSYVILLHRDNIRTLYGHVSEILVSEGQMVQEGQVIAKSGGTPGTKGAGNLTTGAHLHFEVTEGEIHRNPLQYLSLKALDE